MILKILPDNKISQLGEMLQQLFGAEFSESYLNKILRLLLNNLSEQFNELKLWPENTIICRYISEDSLQLNKKEFNKFKTNVGKRNTKKEVLILVEILLPNSLTSQKQKIDRDKLYQFLELIVHYINQGAKIIFISGISGRNGIILRLTSEVVQIINPNILVTKAEELKNNDLLLIQRLNELKIKSEL